MMQHFLIGVVCGFLAHQTRSWVDALPRGYKDWLAYCIGVISTYPTAQYMYSDSDAQGWQRFGKAFFSAFAAVGIGVGVGWLVDTLIGRVERR